MTKLSNPKNCQKKIFLAQHFGGKMNSFKTYTQKEVQLLTRSKMHLLKKLHQWRFLKRDPLFCHDPNKKITIQKRPLRAKRPQSNQDPQIAERPRCAFCRWCRPSLVESKSLRPAMWLRDTDQRVTIIQKTGGNLSKQQKRGVKEVHAPFRGVRFLLEYSCCFLYIFLRVPRMKCGYHFRDVPRKIGKKSINSATNDLGWWCRT